ncbi:hypothetical protein [Streptomyces cyanogenus]|uniref:Secreted protein n=1 Tax=Streptomyces cyanogenus TaxID=80860 RepID=A0ABX7TKH6_STRCY|nr:hypothetical protein [Streptomyces cyanogenus]QTD95986.1 hypothetical protein S1361_01445 [Streptomyces cyanogenus]
MRLTGRTTTPAGRRSAAIGVGAAAIALAGASLAAPAAAQERAAAPAGTYCGPTESFYGNGQWTYAEVQLCLQADSSGAVSVVVNTRQVQYYWGSAWYYASSGSPASWDAKGAAGVGGTSHSYGVSGRQTSAAGSASAALSTTVCGTYSVTMTYHQVGPYWGSDQALDSGQRTYSINVPC